MSVLKRMFQRRRHSQEFPRSTDFAYAADDWVSASTNIDALIIHLDNCIVLSDCLASYLSLLQCGWYKPGIVECPGLCNLMSLVHRSATTSIVHVSAGTHNR